MADQIQTPVTTPTPTGGSKGLGIASLILGILSLCASVSMWCGGTLSIVGLILGVLGLKTSGKSMAVVGIILSAVGLLLMLVFRFIFRGLILNNLMHQFLPNSGY